MLKFTRQLAVVVAAIGVAASVQAQEQPKSGAAGGCAAAACSTVGCQSSQGCPIAAAMKELPQITYLVGQQKLCCPKAADAAARESGGAVRFLVASKTYACEKEAKLALANETEKFVNAFAQTHTCPKSGEITVAGKKLSCADAAAHRAEVAKLAMEKVTLTYLVGEKACHCPVEAKQAAKDTGKSVLFVVGEEKTDCDVTARLNLARAKYAAAVQALIQDEAKEKGA